MGDDLKEMLDDLKWWMTAGLMALAMSLAAAYLKGFIDKRLSRISKRWRNRTMAKMQARIDRIERMSHDPILDITPLNRDQRHLLMSIFYMTTAVFVLVYGLDNSGVLPVTYLNRVTTSLLGLLLALFSFQECSRAFEANEDFSAALRLRMKRAKSEATDESSPRTTGSTESTQNDDD